ncbi:Hypothetical_protein [Hexamita inflata]|uniref:Hypothetical_protein n=1 Tax=Hexamita inflata TaxID=28002 RepID=A0AA86U317_9EUKA|nr:Hypothetical protein HINF_LOCUS27900 [Hexamita inflata]
MYTEYYVAQRNGSPRTINGKYVTSPAHPVYRFAIFDPNIIMNTRIIIQINAVIKYVFQYKMFGALDYSANIRSYILFIIPYNGEIMAYYSYGRWNCFFLFTM